MKGRKPTREERKYINKAGFDTYKWLVQKNTLTTMYIINKDDKIAQIVVTPIILVDFVESLGEERGANGFGSTDKK